jgi:hypothetical protein
MLGQSTDLKSLEKLMAYRSNLPAHVLPIESAPNEASLKIHDRIYNLPGGI